MHNIDFLQCSGQKPELSSALIVGKHQSFKLFQNQSPHIQSQTLNNLMEKNRNKFSSVRLLSISRFTSPSFYDKKKLHQKLIRNLQYGDNPLSILASSQDISASLFYQQTIHYVPYQSELCAYQGVNLVQPLFSAMAIIVASILFSIMAQV